MNRKVTQSFDQPIVSDFNLGQAIEETVQAMLKDKEENPELIIPYKFLEIYNNNEMIELVQTIYQYCAQLITLEHRNEQQKQEPKKQINKQQLSQEQASLTQLARNIALRYGNLLIIHKSLKNIQEDQHVFETILFFISKVLSNGFAKIYTTLIDEELNRLFRSTAFNIPYRRNVEEEKVRRYPQLRPSLKKDHEVAIKNIELRNSIPKQKLKFDMLGSMTSRPGFVKLSPFRALNARSPLISMILPSPKDKIRAFEERRKAQLRPSQSTGNLKRKAKAK